MPQEDSLYIIVSEGSDKWIRKDAGPITRWWKRPSSIERGRRYLSEISPSRWVAEQAFPGYKEQMIVLRQVDDQIKEWTKDLSDALDRAQDAKKYGKPLDVLFWLGQINNRLKLVSNKKKDLAAVQEEPFEEYFGETEYGIPDDYFQTGENKIIEAGVVQDVKRWVGTRKLRELHRKRFLEQERALVKLLNLAKSTVNRTYSLLNEMSKARGSGDIDNYIKLLEKVSEQQGRFENEFQSIYERNFADMVSRIKERKKQEEERAIKIREEAEQREKERLERAGLTATEIAPQPAPVTETIPSTVQMEPSKEVPSLDIPAPTIKEREPESGIIFDVSAPSSQDLPISSVPDTTVDEDEEFGPVTLADPTVRSPRYATTQIDQMIIKMNHARFYDELKKASTKNDPYLLAAMMLKYSEMIDEIDPQTSLELLSVAEGILNG